MRPVGWKAASNSDPPGLFPTYNGVGLMIPKAEDLLGVPVASPPRSQGPYGHTSRTCHLPTFQQPQPLLHWQSQPWVAWGQALVTAPVGGQVGREGTNLKLVAPSQNPIYSRIILGQERRKWSQRR